MRKLAPLLIGVGLALWLLWPRPSAPDGMPATAQELMLADINGRPLGGAPVSDPYVILTFWASWCEPCRTELPALAAAEGAARGRLRVIAINLGESPAEIERFTAQLSLPLTWATDPHGRAAATYRVMGLPTTVLAAPGGAVKQIWRGPVSQQEVTAALPWR